jgi:predicted alpha/beta hydrolase family esterase
MKLLIIPGFSKGNKEWLITLSSEMKGNYEISVIEWNHWVNGSESFDTDQEILKVKAAIGEDKVFIIAKSIGTWVVSKLLNDKQDQIEKLIFAGIPLTGLEKDGNKGDYQILTQYPADRLLILQNQKDPWGSFENVKVFVHSINPKINILPMPREDHAYPYPVEFEKFLK